MRPVTKTFQLELIRQLKGMLTLWEKWLNAQPVEGEPARGV